MSDPITNDKIGISLGKAEALVLFDLLADFRSQAMLTFGDNAERLALMRLHGALESTLIEPLSKDYEQILKHARTLLLEQWGTAQ